VHYLISLLRVDIDKMHLCKIIFTVFLSYLGVKSLITNKIRNNILEGMTYQFYTLFLFDFVFKFQNKQYLDKSYYILSKKIILYLFCKG